MQLACRNSRFQSASNCFSPKTLAFLSQTQPENSRTRCTMLQTGPSTAGSYSITQVSRPPALSSAPIMPLCATGAASSPPLPRIHNITKVLQVRRPSRCHPCPGLERVSVRVRSQPRPAARARRLRYFAHDARASAHPQPRLCVRVLAIIVH